MLFYFGVFLFGTPAKPHTFWLESKVQHSCPQLAGLEHYSIGEYFVLLCEQQSFRL